ncbi:MAG: radical SAM protein [Pyrinomonadaceae bacterium]
MRDLPILESTPLMSKRPLEMGRPVILIGFQNQGNLGIGYLAAVLREAGYDVKVLDFEQDPALILQAIRALDPVLVGFSLIFQFYINKFKSLMEYLRENGVDCHFTMGGHFPSLSYDHTLELAPQLDSVVRFEGEITLLELVSRISSGNDWKDLKGLAYRDPTAGVIANDLRPLVENLDSLPLPDREFRPMSVLGCDIIPLIASRGCSRTCSFCSIHTFYRAVPGKIVRLRKTVNVVDEMRMLYDDRGARIFLFQDDDFPIVGPVWRRWTLDLVDQLYKRDLVGRVIWKINARADVIEAELFSTLRDAGLYMVYMGLESGSEEGLSVLNKGLTVEQNITAVETLKSIDLKYQYGFMLFDPSSSFNSIRENIGFLRRIAGDGSVAATFCRMLPYDGTAIKTQLGLEGRLRGDVTDPDYDFLDPRLDGLFRNVNETLKIVGWIHGMSSVSPQLDWAWHEVAVAERIFYGLSGLEFYKSKLLAITAEANEALFHLVEEMASTHEHGNRFNVDTVEMEAKCKHLLDRMLNARDEFVYNNQARILEELGVTVEGQEYLSEMAAA